VIPVKELQCYHSGSGLRVVASVDIGRATSQEWQMRLNSLLNAYTQTHPLWMLGKSRTRRISALLHS